MRNCLNKIFVLILLTSASFADVSKGDLVSAEYFNDLSGQITELKKFLENKVLKEKVTLWEGNSYLDTSSTYTLWDISKHQEWDSIEMFVAFDNNSNGQKFEISLGSSYNYNTSVRSASTLVFLHNTRYRRIIIKKTGLDIESGNDSYFYLKKVVGVKRIKLN